MNGEPEHSSQPLIKQVRNRLSYRLVGMILVCNGILAIANTAFLFYLDYSKDVASLNESFKNVEASFSDPVSASLWYLDKEQVRIQLRGILSLGNLHYVAVKENLPSSNDDQPILLAEGKRPEKYELTHNIALTFKGDHVGNMFLSASLENIYSSLIKKYLWVLSSQLIKTVIVSILIMLILYYLVIRHVNRIAEYTSSLSINDMNSTLNLLGKRKEHHPDVLDSLVLAVNTMRKTIANDVDKIQEAQSYIKQLNSELEDKVSVRTAELKDSNQHLVNTISELQSTKDRLVEAETMAALGGLVSGVAHEINTPLGVCVTAATQTLDAIKKLRERRDEQTLTREEFDKTTALLKTLSELINSNLQRVAKLVSSFKQVSVDQYTRSCNPITFSAFIEESVDSMRYQYPSIQIILKNQVIQSLMMFRHQDALSIILAHLIQNSAEHGFDDSVSAPKIEISVTHKEPNLMISFTDNGIGLSDEIADKIFNPFFTTKRNQGFAGLGSHIIYNVVTHLLKGQIEIIQRPNAVGAHFLLTVPLYSLMPEKSEK